MKKNAEITLTLSLSHNQITHYKIIATLTKVFKIFFYSCFFWHVKEPFVFLHPSEFSLMEGWKGISLLSEIYQNPPTKNRIPFTKCKNIEGDPPQLHSRS